MAVRSPTDRQLVVPDRAILQDLAVNNIRR